MITLPEPLIIVGAGAKTAVGLTADATYAAMRAGLSGFKVTNYTSFDGQPITGAPIPGIKAVDLEASYLVELAESPISECLESIKGVKEERVGLFFCTERRDSSASIEAFRGYLQQEIESKLNIHFGNRFKIFPKDEISFAFSIIEAAMSLKQGLFDYCIVGGAQTLLRADKLKSIQVMRRLKTGRNSDGLIPGEAGAFIVVSRKGQSLSNKIPSLAEIVSLALITEENIKNYQSNKFQAWTDVVREAVKLSKKKNEDIGFRPTNISGEHSVSVEAGIAIMRNFLVPMPLPQAWYAAGSVGTIGAGVGALLAGWATTAFEKGYGPGCASLCELASDDGLRAAFMIVKSAE